MSEDLGYKYEEGKEVYKEVTLYALSTCGFCKQAIYFLRHNEIKFRYLYMDELEIEAKRKLKAALKEKFKHAVGFPYLVIDDEALVGFREEQWREKFSLE